MSGDQGKLESSLAPMTTLALGSRTLEKRRNGLAMGRGPGLVLEGSLMARPHGPRLSIWG